MTAIGTPLRVHWVRHGKVASHRGDMPLTDEGLEHIKAVGQRFSTKLIDGEIVTILHTSTKRSRDTALVLYQALMQASGDEKRAQVDLLAPTEHQAIRNPDVYVAGERVELVSSAEALALQLPSSGLGLEQLKLLPFWHGFWHDPDRIGYWVNHPDPPGENAEAVARRLLTFAASLLDLPRGRPRRYICVTHSPVLRAFLRYYLLGYDPGEPEYGEAVELELAEGSLTITYRNDYKNVTL